MVAKRKQLSWRDLLVLLIAVTFLVFLLVREDRGDHWSKGKANAARINAALRTLCDENDGQIPGSVYDTSRVVDWAGLDLVEDDFVGAGFAATDYRVEILDRERGLWTVSVRVESRWTLRIDQNGGVLAVKQSGDQPEAGHHE